MYIKFEFEAAGMKSNGLLLIKIGPKGALGSHEIRLIHSAPSIGQSIDILNSSFLLNSECYVLECMSPDVT